MSKKDKIVFIGSTKRGHLALEALVQDGANIVGVISMQQHSHEIEQYGKIIKNFCTHKKISLIETATFNKNEIEEKIKNNWKPDLIIVVGCRVMIPLAIYQFPKFGTIAVHDSLLPQYRGFAPLHWAILNNEKYAGISLFYLSEKTDEGKILDQKKIQILETDSIPQLYQKTCIATTEVLLKNYKKILSNSVRPRSQKHNKATYGCSRSPEDGYIDWQSKSIEIINKIRALTYPFPGAFTYLDGKKLYIWSAKIEKKVPVYKGKIPGKVILINNKEKSITVLTIDGAITLFEVGHNPYEKFPATTVIKSVRSKLGVSVPDLMARLEFLENLFSEKIPLTGKKNSKKVL